MPWSTRNLSSLMRQGIYVNDYPGLQLDSQQLNYFHGRFPLAEGAKTSPGGRGGSNVSTTGAKNIGSSSLTSSTTTIRGTSSSSPLPSPPPTIRLPWQGKYVILDAIENLILFREYSAEGSNGVKKVTYEEKKPVYFALEKFLGTYLRGLARAVSPTATCTDRKQLFDNFGPQKTFGFFGDGSLYNAHLRFFLNREDYTRNNRFREINLTIPQVEFEDVANLK
jgi:hypothetical protein